MLPRGDFTEIPRINLALGEGDLLPRLRHALINVGFLYIESHGVSLQLIEDIRNLLPSLFALSEEEKNLVALSKSPHFLGYSSDGSETTAGKTDRREQFEFATELTSIWTEGLPLYERLRGPNPVGEP